MSAPVGATEPARPVADFEAARAFLRLLWPNGPPTASFLTTWRKRDKRSSQPVNVDDAARELCAEPDVYLSVAAMRAFTLAEIGKRRGGADEVLFLPAFVADVDVLEASGHKKPEIPATFEEAIGFAHGLPLPPSLILDSGGGLHLWWLLAERAAAKLDSGEPSDLSRRSDAWQREILRRGAERGWRLDNVGDLPRVMRCAGTLNGKKRDRSPLVRLIAPLDLKDVRRYELANFEPHCRAARRPRASAAAKPNGEYDARAAAPDSATAPDVNGAPTPTPAGRAAWLARAAERLDGALKFKTISDDSIVVLVTCPACGGRESAGRISRGTAHVARMSGRLRCKRESCEASGDGLPIETWGARFLSSADAAELRVLRAKDPDAHFSHTDDGNAQRFARRHGADVRHVEGLGWHEWVSTHWRLCATMRGVADRALDRARDTARAIAQEADTPGLSNEECDAVRTWSRVSRSEPRLRAMVTLARCELAASTQDFDADPRAFNVENGTLDLPTGKLRSHRREDRLTKLAGCAYDQNARSADVDRYFSRLSAGDPEFGAYIERLIGCALSGAKRDDAIVWLLGPGGAGKTTFLEAMAAMLGDYASAVDFRALEAGQRTGAGPRPEIVALRGARFVRANEVRDGVTLDAATLKALSGGDTISARACFQSPIEFRPQFAVWLAMNRAPHIDKADSGMQRRLIVLPFEPIPEDDKDAGLRDRMQAPAARRALLALAVRGCLTWQRDGLGTCARVEAAKLRYWDSAGAAVVGKFIETVCERDSEAWTSRRAVREALDVFVKAEGGRGLPARPDRALADCLRAAGFQEAERAERGWRGLRLRPMPKPEPRRPQYDPTARDPQYTAGT